LKVILEMGRCLSIVRFVLGAANNKADMLIGTGKITRNKAK
jgi:hypothetical protein